jgi:hypothetical protein
VVFCGEVPGPSDCGKNVGRCCVLISIRATASSNSAPARIEKYINPKINAIITAARNFNNSFIGKVDTTTMALKPHIAINHASNLDSAAILWIAGYLRSTDSIFMPLIPYHIMYVISQ